MKQWLYAFLTVVGLADGIYFVVQFVQSLPDGEPILPAFAAAATANPIASYSLLVVLLCLIAFVVSIVPEGRDLGMRHWWVYIVLVFMAPFAFVFPLFFFMRERKLANM
ncbi:MAG: DUF2834 domain-containing protein [Chloroflexota bacterium]